MMYNNSLLYVATKNEIEVCEISDDLFQDEPYIIDVNDIIVRRIPTKLPIFAIPMNEATRDCGIIRIAFETDGNLLEFDQLTVSDINHDNWSYLFE